MNNEHNELEKMNIQRKREMVVWKANAWVQDGYISRTYSKMTAQQIDLLNFMVSKIKPTDEVGQTYIFSVAEFRKVYNLNEDGGFTYTSIKNDLQALSAINEFVPIGNERYRQVKYFNDIVIDKGIGTLEISFHPSIYSYLYQLNGKGKKYYFPLDCQAAMRYPSSKILYELLKSYKNLEGEKVLSIDFIRDKLGVGDIYPRYQDFRRYVLSKAIAEINAVSDIVVDYKPKKINSRSFTHIAFTIADVRQYEEGKDGGIRETYQYAARKINRHIELDDEFAEEMAKGKFVE